MLRALVLSYLVPSLFTATGTQAATGARGVITRGPVRPACVAEESCRAPASNVLVAFHSSSVTRKVHTDVNGRYRVVLPPGTYAVTLTPGGARPRPRTAVVVAGRVTVANFSIDTGIR